MTNKLKISVITAVYNNEETIANAIESVKSQTYENIEYIVVDGNSTDATREVIKRYEQDIDVFISENDDGIYHALNKGITLATGDVIALLHSDDEYANVNIIQNVVDNFLQNQVDCVYGDVTYINRGMPQKVIRYWKAGEYHFSKLAYGWMPPHPAFFVTKALYQELGLYDTRYQISADYDLMLRFFTQKKMQVAYLSKVLVKMRVGGKSNILENITQKMIEDYQSARSNNIGGLITVLFKNTSKFRQFVTRESYVSNA